MGQRPSQFKMITFLPRQWTFEGNSGWTGMKTQTMAERMSVFFSFKKSIIDKILAVRLAGFFWAMNEVGCSFGFGLWRLPTMPGRRLHFLYFIGYLFSAHFFGISAKFGHSIPRPLDLDGHSVKRPSVTNEPVGFENISSWNWRLQEKYWSF
jgi:hypothetical protein